jgi:NADP-dependent 3-hydroxy acid dehydrogenase YdfG
MKNNVLITGASSGIGKATARVFAEHGFNIILTGRRADRLTLLADELKTKYKIEVKNLIFDVRNPTEVERELYSLGKETLSNIDILINNAGLAKGLDFIDNGKLEHWDTMIDTNIKGLLYITRFISPYMVVNKKGHIINIGSIAGKEVYPKGAVYCASKFAVDALTKGMRMDLYTSGIRVSQVSPGHVEETEFAKVRFDGDEDKAKIYADFKPLKAEDVARTIFFITSQPDHVNIQDVIMMGTQQASVTMIDRSGR